MDPLHKLLKKDEDREAAVRALGVVHSTLDDAIAAYRSKADLTRAGFPDPTRLPKVSTRSTDADS